MNALACSRLQDFLGREPTRSEIATIDDARRAMPRGRWLTVVDDSFVRAASSPFDVQLGLDEPRIIALADAFGAMAGRLWREGRL